MATEKNINHRSHKMKLLIVDDSEAIRNSIKTRLQENEGVTEILEARGFAGTVDVILKERPDVMILDIHLGDGSGFDILRGLKAAGADVAAIVFSGFGYTQYKERALELGALKFFSKCDDIEFFEFLEQVTVQANKISSVGSKNEVSR